MKVYMNARQGSVSGGMILVAANTKEEAILTFRAYEYYRWLFREYDSSCWEEMPMLTANVDTPQVIAEEGYSE